MRLGGLTSRHAAAESFVASRTSVWQHARRSYDQPCPRRHVGKLKLRVRATSSKDSRVPEQLQPPATPPATDPATVPASSPQPFPAVGTASILFVAVMWGTYTPVLRFAYGLPGAPDPFVLNAVRGVLQCGALLAATQLFPSSVSYQPAASAKEEEEVEMLLAAGGAAEGSAPRSVQQPAAREGRAGTGEGAMQQAQQVFEGWGPQLQRVLQSINPAILGGFEIGFYNTAGTTAQSFALAYTTATRGAFLIQATAIFTPLLLAASGASPRRQVWVGSLLAMAGTVLVALEGSNGGGAALAAESAPSQLIVGDALTIFAALCYSMATLRIGRYAKLVAPLNLALGKSVTLAIVSATLLCVTLVHLGGGLAALEQLWPSYGDPLAWGVIAYSAVGPGALAAYFHVKGQSLVPPAEAQILFSTVPLWSVLFAALLLNGEGGGLYTWVGGAFIVMAGVVAAL